MPDPLGLIATAATPGIQPLQAAGNSGGSGAASGTSFKDVLMNNIEQVNKMQQEAQREIEDLSTGKTHDYAHVIMATQKADLAFQMLLQVRNKLTDAYQEINQIRV
jgi:flagellar hook-basal body complex protein FliE